MCNTLWAVIVGGVIGSVVPLVTLWLNHSKWKREAKLEYLKSERLRLENLFRENLKKFREGMAEQKYDIDMISDIMILMPNSVDVKFEEFILDEDKTLSKCKQVQLNLSIEMKKILKEIDDEIRKMTS